VFLDKLTFIHCHELAFLYNELSAHYRGIHADGLAEDSRRNGIVSRACVVEAVEIDREEVGAFAGFERADVFATKHSRAAARAEMDGIAGGYQFSFALTLPSPGGRGG